MRLLIFILLLPFYFTATAQTYNFSFTQIPFGDPDIISPGRGAEQWHNGTEGVSNPHAEYHLPSQDLYYRFVWNKLEGPTLGSYTWTYFDGLVQEAIDNGQKFSFGIMTVFTGYNEVFYDGARSVYPLYLHNLMQAESVNNRDWLSGGDWIPNYNSTNYLTRLRALYAALYAHIKTTSYEAEAGPHDGEVIDFEDVILSIDIRGYGNYNEWHSGGYATWDSHPTGRQPTEATLLEIIDIHRDELPDWPLSAMIAGFHGRNSGINLFQVYPSVAYELLTGSNAWGRFGWRRDQWGARDLYLDGLLAGNTETYLGSDPFGTIVVNSYKYGPVTGEPPAYVGPPLPYYGDLMNQITTYHATSFGNGNWGTVMSTEDADLARAAFKKAGYRFELTGGSAVVAAGLTINLDWENVGIAPTYENWTVEYSLRTGAGVTVWDTVSYFAPKLFLPGDSTVVDAYSMPAINEGAYDLYVKITDPNNYRLPLPLAIAGRTADGAYLLSSITVETGTPPPPPPGSRRRWIWSRKYN